MSELIFLMGSERSGSNLITKLFDAHPEVSGPNTAHLADSILPELHRYFPFGAARWEALIADVDALLRAKNAVWTRDFTLAELRGCAEPGDVAGLLGYVYGQEGEACGKQVVLVKENRIYEFAGFLGAHFPGARYLYQWRDPRDMAASWKQSLAIRGGALRAADTWQRDQRGFLAMRAAFSAVKSIPAASYEELVGAPEATLRRLCAELGIAFDSAMLRHEEQPGARQNAAAAADWGNLSRPIFAGSAGSYRERLTREEVRYVEAVCFELMVALGYSPESKPISAEETEGLRARLSADEPVEKPGYAAVSDEERRLRREFEDARAQIQRRPVLRPR